MDRDITDPRGGAVTLLLQSTLIAGTENSRIGIHSRMRLRPIPGFRGVEEPQ